MLYNNKERTRSKKLLRRSVPAKHRAGALSDVYSRKVKPKSRQTGQSPPFRAFYKLRGSRWFNDANLLVVTSCMFRDDDVLRGPFVNSPSTDMMGERGKWRAAEMECDVLIRVVTSEWVVYIYTQRGLRFVSASSDKRTALRGSVSRYCKGSFNSD